MDNLPIFMTLRDKRAVVVGSGVVAARRAELLLRAGARVTVFAASLSEEFDDLRQNPGLTHVARDPETGDFHAGELCCVALSNKTFEDRVAAMARAAGVIMNVADRPELCDFIMPSILDRSPLVVAISTGGASPILGRMLKARLEALIPAAYGRLAGFMGRARAQVNGKLPDVEGRRRFWERTLDGPIAEMVLAGDEPGAARALAADLTAEDGATMTGEVYLVGAGPGDPDLLTFRAQRLMQKADVVLYDRLVGDDILNLVRREAERVYVGKRRADHAVPQEEIGEMLVALAKQGKRVLRLKGGDPFIFGRGGEEIEKLAEHRIPFQVCPGVTAASGCSTYSGIPLTHRDHAQSCVFVTGHGKDGPLALDWGALIRPGQTVAVYMGLHHLEQLMQAFVTHGAAPDLPAAVIENGTRANQRVITGTLATLAEKARAAEMRGPTIIIVGGVVSLRDKLDWRMTQN
jgi:uroporphyrin-III C-methyltransferase/precorrin-2 dehydrogenase/sirohydrochlorin ferrochelatase